MTKKETKKRLADYWFLIPFGLILFVVFVAPSLLGVNYELYDKKSAALAPIFEPVRIKVSIESQVVLNGNLERGFEPAESQLVLDKELGLEVSDYFVGVEEMCDWDNEIGYRYCWKTKTIEFEGVKGRKYILFEWGENHYGSLTEFVATGKTIEVRPALLYSKPFFKAWTDEYNCFHHDENCSIKFKEFDDVFLRVRLESGYGAYGSSGWADGTVFCFFHPDIQRISFNGFAVPTPLPLTDFGSGQCFNNAEELTFFEVWEDVAVISWARNLNREPAKELLVVLIEPNFVFDEKEKDFFVSYAEAISYKKGDLVVQKIEVRG